MGAERGYEYSMTLVEMGWGPHGARAGARTRAGQVVGAEAHPARTAATATTADASLSRPARERRQVAAVVRHGFDKYCNEITTLDNNDRKCHSGLPEGRVACRRFASSFR